MRTTAHEATFKRLKIHPPENFLMNNFVNNTGNGLVTGLPMKSYWIRHNDGNAVLELREVPVPEPAPGQILLRVRAASLNRGDLLGAIKFHRAAEGRPAGVDAAGEVHAIGE